MTYFKEDLTSWIKQIYKLSLFFPKKEPLRYKIRDLATEILAQFIFLSNGNLTKKNSNNLIKNLEILDSYFEIIKEQNWVSSEEILKFKENFKMLKSEIEKNKIEKESDSNDPPLHSILTLNERQQKIIEFLKQNEKVQVRQIKEIFPNISKRTLRRDFQKLFKKGILERFGEKNNTFYKLKINNG